MPSRLDALRARLAAATPGPWLVTHGCPFVVADSGQVTVALPPSCDGHGTEDDDDPVTDQILADMAFIAHAPADLAALLAVVENAEILVQTRAPKQHGIPPKKVSAGVDCLCRWCRIGTALAALTTE